MNLAFGRLKPKCVVDSASRETTMFFLNLCACIHSSLR